MKIVGSLFAIIALSGILSGAAIADDKVLTKFDSKPVPSGPPKAYKGPEGQVIVLLEINDGKEILVHCKNLGGELEGKTLRYLFEDLGSGKKNVYLDWKRGSKPYRRTLLTARDNQWEFYHPTKPNLEFRLAYSEAASETFKAEDVIKAIKP